MLTELALLVLLAKGRPQIDILGTITGPAELEAENFQTLVTDGLRVFAETNAGTAEYRLTLAVGWDKLGQAAYFAALLQGDRQVAFWSIPLRQMSTEEVATLIVANVRMRVLGNEAGRD